MPWIKIIRGREKDTAKSFTIKEVNRNELHKKGDEEKNYRDIIHKSTLQDQKEAEDRNVHVLTGANDHFIKSQQGVFIHVKSRENPDQSRVGFSSEIKEKISKKPVIFHDNTGTNVDEMVSHIRDEIDRRWRRQEKDLLEQMDRRITAAFQKALMDVFGSDRHEEPSPLEDIKKELDNINQSLKNLSKKISEYNINIDKVELTSPTLDKLTFNLGELDIKDLSGSLSIGNNFGTSLRSQGQQKKDEGDKKGKQGDKKEEDKKKEEKNDDQERDVEEDRKDKKNEDSRSQKEECEFL